MPGSKNLVVAGKPGVGKTTLIKETVWPYRSQVAGFYTEELVEDRQRLGFKLKSFAGEEGVLASKHRAGPPRVGKYGVDLGVLERIGVAELRRAAEGGRMVVIDEIGSMETLSTEFRSVVLELFAGPKPVLATIRFGAQPFTDEVKALPETEVKALTRENYREVRDEVRSWIEERLRG
jgi:nucleoside-triphosphatase